MAKIRSTRPGPRGAARPAGQAGAGPAGAALTGAALAAAVLGLAVVAGCERARVDIASGYGPDPALPAPRAALVPTIDIAPAEGWQEGEAPVPAPGLAVNAFAEGLDHPRWLHVLPNGDVLVAESNAQPKPPPATLKGAVMAAVMARAGAGVPSPDRITLLRDADGDGTAEVRVAFLTGLTSPFGMALVGTTLYVANSDAVVAFPYRRGDTRIEGSGRTLAPLPAGPINHHWTKDLIASPDGAALYATVGSNSNVGENGIAAERLRADVLTIDIATGATEVFAWGLRNPNGLVWQPDSGALWVAVNERDEIGSDLVPDYMTALRPGGFYGWPYSYFGDHVDARVTPPRPDLVARAIVPDYALGPHTGSLGLTFYDGALFPAAFRHGAFVGQHGSWNRVPPSGYKVIFVPFAAGRPAGPPRDILTGFLAADGSANGRPVGVAVAADGALLVADDVGNRVWRVVPGG